MNALDRARLYIEAYDGRKASRQVLDGRRVSPFGCHYDPRILRDHRQILADLVKLCEAQRAGLVQRDAEIERLQEAFDSIVDRLAHAT